MMSQDNNPRDSRGVAARLPSWISFPWLSAFLIGCGTLVGNPKKPNDGTQSSKIQWPVIELHFAEDITSVEEGATLHLIQAGNQRFTAMHAVVKRMDRTFRDINAVVAELEAENVQEIGRFSAQGPNKDVSISVQEMIEAEGQAYSYEAILCASNGDGVRSPFLHMQWSKDGSRMRLVKDHKMSPWYPQNRLDFASEITLQREGDATFVALRNFGQLSGNSPRIDGPGIAELTKAKWDAEGNVELAATIDRFQYPAASDVFTGDSYLVGRLGSVGGGAFVGYDKSLNRCSLGFDETREDPFVRAQSGQPGFCLGRILGEAADFGADALDSALEELRDIGIVKSSELVPVAFDQHVRCDF